VTVPKYLVTNAMYNPEPHPCSSRYNITIKAGENSTLPPILNAFEYFSVMSTANLGTVIRDGMYTELPMDFYLVYEMSVHK
jgi:hypothetical protein